MYPNTYQNSQNANSTKKTLKNSLHQMYQTYNFLTPSYSKLPSLVVYYS